MAYRYGGRNTATFGKLQGFKQIVAWQAASDLNYAVNGLSGGFGHGYYGLADQMRRAAIAVSGNIAEGYCSGSLPNYIRYGHIARGSNGELGSYIQNCERSGLITNGDLTALLKHYHDTTTYWTDSCSRSSGKNRTRAGTQPTE